MSYRVWLIFRYQNHIAQFALTLVSHAEVDQVEHGTECPHLILQEDKDEPIKIIAR